MCLFPSPADVLPSPSLRITESTPECVQVEIQPPENTICIDNYTVEVVTGSVTVQEVVVAADELEVMICDLNLCVNTYTFRTSSNGSGLPSDEPSEIHFTATLSSEAFIFYSFY